VRRFLEEAWNKGNPDIASEVLASDYAFHGSGMPPGPDGARRLISMFRSAFPDARATFDDVIGEEDKVVVRWTTQATHGGEFFGVAPTGRTVTYAGIDIFRLDGGMIVERWSMSDNIGLMQQLG
jgi:steroid delta-isomerase-like uncharacterized protein